ncbi:hypothetical protein [Phytoactinopolyspora limicola]|uniref:hypothetical protein n=1 Tax=Phytoactinopolyspora limicola TaxID=2715536 RepID=UPI00140AC0D2|nr:hypothetical protein [Phytoactinopolyspora limicola]
MAPPNEIDPPTIEAAGTRLTGVAPEAEHAIPDIYKPDLDGMNSDEAVIDGRVKAVEVLQVLRSRAEHQGKLDLAAYEQYKDI